ncbi:MAG: hypothetical protein IKM33_04525 [Clostridia bacterium]|nr:hypothetical protein [Clostridia bacterium]
MTVTSTPAAPGRRYRFSILRVLLCGILMSLLVAASLYLKYSAVDFFHARLLDQESKTSAWILKQISYALPWIFMCIFHAITYRRHDRHDGVAAREMFWEVFLVTIFTYLVLLPYLQGISDDMYAAALEAGATIPQTEGKVDQTFIMIFHEWFVRLSIPLIGLMVFYSTRARRQQLHPETEVDEPLMTRAEYDALTNPSTSNDACDEAPEEADNGDPETRTEQPNAE